MVSGEGIVPDPSKIEAVTEWLSHPPSSSSELQTFLGFVGYYRSFIHNFASMAQPLYKLIGGGVGNKGKPHPIWEWTQDCQIAFKSLITKLTRPPILHYPNFPQPFVLHIDASSEALGAALYQSQQDKQDTKPSRTKLLCLPT